MARLRIPFRLPDFNAGVMEAKGIMYFEDELLIFEVESAVFGEFSKRQKIIKIEPRAIEEIHHEKHVFRDKLYIRPKQPDLLEAMPGEFLREINLKIWSKHRAKLELLINQLQLRME